MLVIENNVFTIDTDYREQSENMKLTEIIQKKFHT
jgi:hypothetical protein